MTDHSKIAVIEGQWFKRSNLSIRRVFDMMSESEVENINGYHYEMACSKAALREAIPRLIETKHIAYLFIGQHGNGEDKLILPDRKKLSMKKLAKILDKPADKSRPTDFKLHGLHLSSCGLMTEHNARILLASKRIEWVSGYSKDCDWLESTLLDTLFASHLYDVEENTRISHIEEVSEIIHKLAAGMVEKSGFSIYRRAGKTVKRLGQIV